jgi:hypothetical protein
MGSSMIPSWFVESPTQFVSDGNENIYTVSYSMAEIPSFSRVYLDNPSPFTFQDAT